MHVELLDAILDGDSNSVRAAPILHTSVATMQITIDEKERMIIQLGVDGGVSERFVRLMALAFAIGLIYPVFMVPTLLLKIVLLPFLGPLSALFFSLAIPERYFSGRIVIERSKGTITKFSRWLSWKRKHQRPLNDISSVLVVEDKASYGKAGIAPRFGLFLCLEPKAIPHRVLFLEYMFSPWDGDEAIAAAERICAFTGWRLEQLKLSQMNEESDVVWESW